MALFSFLDHLNFIEDDSSRYEVGISDEGFSYLDLVSEKKARQLTFKEKQQRETSAALDGSTRARGQSNVKQFEALDHDEVCFDTDLVAILRDIERRRQKASVFPWALGMISVVVVVWLALVFSLDHPLLALLLSALIVVPGGAFALVNVWFWDRSQKDVHFAYKISGKGKTAFAQLNKAFQAVSESNQTLLLSGRRHFEDTRYSGGAESLPDFRDVQCSRGKPPLLELDFDVWHLRVFNRDLFFMPDHVLVCDGAKMGGVNYANLEVATQTAVTQSRGSAASVRDAKVVGKTHRFVNNDGSPDQRFNNNREILLIEYGVLKLGGAGLDFSLFLTNQESALAVPGELAEIRDLARMPAHKIAEQRQADAAARRKMRQDEVFSVVLDTLCCVMFADGKSADSEREKIQQLMKRTRAPWDEAEVDSRMRGFRNRAVDEGLDTVIQDVCSRASTIRSPRQKEALCKCLDQVVLADGEVHPRETAIRNQIVEAIGEVS